MCSKFTVKKIYLKSENYANKFLLSQIQTFCKALCFFAINVRIDKFNSIIKSCARHELSVKKL
jgi:hypothetical protein